MAGDDLVSSASLRPKRWAIYFGDIPLDEAERYPAALQIVRERVYPERSRAKNRVKRELWWQFERHAKEVIEEIAKLSSYLITPETSKYLVVCKVPASWRPSNGCIAFATDDMGLFAILQSTVHETWARRPGMSKLETRCRYNARNCFRTCPLPNNHRELSTIGAEYYRTREQMQNEREEGLTQLYNRFHTEKPADDIRYLRDLHVRLDELVASAYDWDGLRLAYGLYETKQGVRFTISEKARREVLDRLLKLNHERYAEEIAQGLHEKKKPKRSTAKRRRQSKPQPPGPSLFDGGDE